MPSSEDQRTGESDGNNNSTAQAEQIQKSLVDRFTYTWSYILLVLIGLIVFFSVWQGDKFFAEANFRQIALNASQLMLLAVGATFVIITAGIDLSVSAVLVFSAVVGAKVMVRLSGTPAEVHNY